MELTKPRQPREKALPVDSDTVSMWRNEVVKYHMYEIAQGSGLHVNTVSFAINNGIATETTKNKLNEYFSKRAA